MISLLKILVTGRHSSLPKLYVTNSQANLRSNYELEDHMHARWVIFRLFDFYWGLAEMLGLFFEINFYNKVSVV